MSIVAAARKTKTNTSFLPTGISSFFKEVGEMSAFAGKFFRQVFTPPYNFKETLRQCYAAGNKSFGLVAITAFIMGVVLTIQSRPTLVEFGAESWLPRMVSVSLVREIAPIITALICAGKIGSGIGAELGSMRVTEQIDAMEVSATNPFKYLVVTRIIATTLMLPLLVIMADAIGIFGGYIGYNLKDHISIGFYFYKVFHQVSFSDLFPATIKTFVFGFAIGLIGCYKGYTTKRGTEGVGIAANSAVVVASLLVFIIDMLAAQISTLYN